jgi:hypothetical protein
VGWIWLCAWSFHDGILYTQIILSYASSGIPWWAMLLGYGLDVTRESVFDSWQKQRIFLSSDVKGVRKHMSCRQIFKDYSVLNYFFTQLEVVFLTVQRFTEKSVQIHNYSTWRKLAPHVQFCNIGLFRKSVMNMGLKLYKIKNCISLYLLKESWDSFCYNMHFI